MLNLEIFKKEIRQNYKSVRPKVIRICYNIHIRGDFMHSNDDKREWIDPAQGLSDSQVQERMMQAVSIHRMSALPKAMRKYSGTMF